MKFALALLALVAQLCLLVACSDSGEETCGVGWIRAPLGTCAVDLKHPPCECVDLNQASCCAGDLCCGPEQAECPMGVPSCADGVVSCSGSAFLAFENLCRTP